MRMEDGEEMKRRKIGSERRGSDLILSERRASEMRGSERRGEEKE